MTPSPITALSTRGLHRMNTLVRPGLGFGSMRTAQRTLAGYEAIAMVRKGQAHQVGGRDMPAQTALVAGLFGFTAR